MMSRAHRLLSWLRHLPDRLLHPRRRAAAAELVQQSDVASLLFVCYGNVCRSPYAEAAFARAVEGRPGRRIEVASAGFVGPDRAPPDNALAAAARRGLDTSGHRSRLLTSEIVRAASVVVVMATDQAKAIRAQYGRDVRVLVLGDIDPLPIEKRTVRDPWGQGPEVFDAVFERIDRCLGALLPLVVEGDERDLARLRAGSFAGDASARG